MDALRAHRRPVTATRLAEELEVSVRTIYRDVRTLAELGAPIEGEAGLGYLLRSGFFLPPLMFGPDELESLVLGARWVKEQGDPALASAADRALAKIATASPKDLRDMMADTQLWAPRFYKNPAVSTVLKPIREAIRSEHKISITYVDEQGAATERVIWPIALAFLEGKRLVAAWCELRAGFRHFRADRISAYQPLQLRYPQRRHALLQQWRKAMNIPQQQPDR
jgi:predicted DNA-binding transcriptional regulator YafY